MKFSSVLTSATIIALAVFLLTLGFWVEAFSAHSSTQSVIKIACYAAVATFAISFVVISAKYSRRA